MNKKEFISTWLKNFAKNVPQKEIETKVNNQYIWHVFSFKLIPKMQYIEGDDAIKQYLSMDKNGAIYLRLRRDETTQKLQKEMYDIAGIGAETYIVDKDFKWTFILTHEDGFGPYFMKK